MNIENQMISPVKTRELPANHKLTILQALNRYYYHAFHFSGKATRMEYLVSTTYQWMMSVVFVFLVYQLISAFGEQPSNGQLLVSNIFQWGWWVLVYLPSFASTFRRSNDAVGGKWLAWLSYISMTISMIAYTTMIGLTAFDNSYVGWFYLATAFMVIFLISGLGSWLTLLLRKNKKEE